MSDYSFQPVTLIGESQRRIAKQNIDHAPDGFVARVDEATRTIEQNMKLWPMLKDLSDQIIWHGVKLSSAEWKDFSTATLKKQKFVPDLDGQGFIAVGGKTSTMSKKVFTDLIEIIYMIGARNDVTWSEKAQKVIDEYGQEWEVK